MNIPILCMGCGRRGSIDPFRATAASLRCICGSSDFDVDDMEAILGSRKTATEALDTISSSYSASWHGEHWSIIQEQREGMCLWTVQTDGRPKTGGNYDVGLREAVEQVRAELDARGLPGDPEQLLPPDREGSWILSSKRAFVEGSTWSTDPVYGFTYRWYTTWGLVGRVDPSGSGFTWQLQEPASFLHFYGEQKTVRQGTAPSVADAQTACDRAAESVEKAGSRRTAAPSASEGLGQPVTGDCPRCGSGTYRGDLGYCPQCQLGGPGDPSAKKDSFASLQGTGRKTASVPASPIEGNRMLPIVRWETPDGTEYVDIYNNADHGDYAWQAGWTKDNYDPYAETHGGSMPHHIVSFPEFLQAMARRVKFDKLVLKFNRTGYDVEGIINGPLLPRLVPIEGSRTASVEAETKRIAKIDEITLGITTSNPGISPSRARALAIKTVDRYPGVLG